MEDLMVEVENNKIIIKRSDNLALVTTDDFLNCLNNIDKLTNSKFSLIGNNAICDCKQEEFELIYKKAKYYVKAYNNRKMM